MRVLTSRRRMAVAAVSAAALLAAAACSDDGGGDEPTDPNEPITLTVHVFGGAGFGYEELVSQYEAEHENITVDYQIITDRYDDEFRPGLIQQLDAGTAPDIAAIEEQGIAQFMSMNDAWVDLAQYGLDSRESEYPAWKWELGHTNDGKLAALGTDVGGMGICYRSDLFEQADLPTEREEVAQAWSTWDGFVDVAQQFLDSGVDAAFVDSPQQMYNIRMVQEAGNADGLSYFDRDNNYILAESPAVRTAFDFVQQLIDMGAVGNFQSFTDDWSAAQASGAYAVMGCPAWMLGVVEGNAGEDNQGNWDFAAAPGVGGNWGGSWLGVTKDSDHPEQAADLANFLTSDEGQLGAWEAISAFPSSPAAQADPAVADTSNAYFNDAPTGQLIAASIQAFEPVYYGSIHSAVRSGVENVLIEMVQGNVSGEEAWNAFVAAGQEVVDLEG